MIMANQLKILKIIILSLIAVVSLWLVLTRPASAQTSVPTIISHQGRLLNSSNQPVTSNVSVVFSIYDAATGGSQVWTETQSITPDNLGFYETFLGGVTPLPSALPNPSYLQITVQSETLSPRLQFGSVPFAQKAGTSSMLQRARTFGSGLDQTDDGLVAGRTVTINKQQASSYLRVSYTDNFRAWAPPPGNYAMGKWEILLNNQPCSDPGPIAQFIYNDDQVSERLPTIDRSETIVGYCKTAGGTPLGSGPVTITVYADGTPFNEATSFDLLTGFPGVGFTQYVLEAEEAL